MAAPIMLFYFLSSYVGLLAIPRILLISQLNSIEAGFAHFFGYTKDYRLNEIAVSFFLITIQLAALYILAYADAFVSVSEYDGEKRKFHNLSGITLEVAIIGTLTLTVINCLHCVVGLLS